MSATHSVAVAFAGGRYPFRPTCSCGWVCRGFLTEEAAQIVADDHAERSGIAASVPLVFA